MGANLGEGPANVTAISALYLIIKVFFNCDQCVFLSLALLWTSPELLRDPMPPRNGSQPGDIYSMAIIIQEILYRCGPYEALGEMPMVPKGNF